MPKKPLSLTLAEANWLWLKARARAAGAGNVSETVDQLVTQARTGRTGGLPAIRSVVGTIDLPDDFDTADDGIRELFDASLNRTTDQLRRREPRKAPMRRRRRG